VFAYVFAIVIILYYIK